MPPPAPARAEIWGTEQFILPSRALGRDMLIQVARAAAPDARKVPVVYLLDGNLMFGIAADTALMTSFTSDAGPAYIVGVGYPSQLAKDWLVRRSMDLVHAVTTHPEAGGMPTGGGALFERFLREELLPAIEARYPVDPANSTLFGHDYGGLFAAHVLLNAPGSFRNYVIGSPGLWAEPALLEQAARFRGNGRTGVFLAVGGSEDADMQKSTKSLLLALTRKDAGLKVESLIIKGEGHTTMLPSFISRGLRWAVPVEPNKGAP
ncbi:alpha/beta hydrolase [Chitinimonas sp.]|uniref:alpha/beta hydrolase n=1 Tax=Chitinimonas sp. TaxID=1934313 RepID=UPI002F93635B